MDAEYSRHGLLVRHLRKRCDQSFLGRRDQGRLVGGDAALEQRVAGDRVAGGIRSGEVDAGVAVHLQVDEARNCEASAPLRRKADGDDEPVRDLDVTGQQRALDDRRFDAQPHRGGSSASARRTTPPAASSLRRASAASRPESRETIATLTSPAGDSSAVSTSASVAPVAITTALRARLRSFALLATTS